MIFKELKRLKDRVRQARYRALRAEQVRMYREYVAPLLATPAPSLEEDNLPTTSTDNAEVQGDPDATEPALDWEEIGTDTTTANQVRGNWINSRICDRMLKILYKCNHC